MSEHCRQLVRGTAGFGSAYVDAEHNWRLHEIKAVAPHEREVVWYCTRCRTIDVRREAAA